MHVVGFGWVLWVRWESCVYAILQRTTVVCAFALVSSHPLQ